MRWSFKNREITANYIKTTKFTLLFFMCIIWKICPFCSSNTDKAIFSLLTNLLTACFEGLYQSLCHTFIIFSYGLGNKLLLLPFSDWLDKEACFRRSSHRICWYYVSPRDCKFKNYLLMFLHFDLLVEIIIAF